MYINSDQDWFVTQIGEELGKFFELTFHNLCPNKSSPVFGDFISAYGVYEDLNDQAVLRLFPLNIFALFCLRLQFMYIHIYADTIWQSKWTTIIIHRILYD